MSLQIKALQVFTRQAKRLAKKYRLLARDLADLEKVLLDNPEAGIELFAGCYKIRLKNSSTNTGKSGGFRVVYYFVSEDKEIYLMSIYSKTEQASVDEAFLLEMIKNSID